MAKKFDNLSKNNKNINALSSIFSNDEPEQGGGDAPSSTTQKTSEILKTSVTLRTSVISTKSTPEFVRQTLILAGEDLDFLRNLVYTRRLEGKVNYTQKEALQEVIQSFRLLHQEVVKERSDEVKIAEQKRSESIIKGKQ
jgi:hypothetical protein